MIDKLDTMLLRTIFDIDKEQGDGDFLEELKQGVRQAYEQIKSLLTPIPEDKLDEFVNNMSKNIGCYPYQTRRMLKEYDELK